MQPRAARAPVALVTGASRGIGRVIALRLAEAGYRVAAAARSLPETDELKAVDGLVPMHIDVTNRDEVEATFDLVESTLGPLDLLVNNAGCAGPTGVVSWEHSPADWWRVFEVNVLGTFLCCRSAIPSMTARQAGRIVNLSSNAAVVPIGQDFASVISSEYMASKAAIIRYGEALAAEGRAAGVSVFTVSPGTVKTEMTAEPFRARWNDEDLWSPPDLVADLIEFIGTGALDSLSGRYIHAARDDWRTMAARTQEIVDDDLHTLRVRSARSL